jgi:hypothetical protein
MKTLAAAATPPTTTITTTKTNKGAIVDLCGGSEAWLCVRMLLGRVGHEPAMK